MPSLSVIGRPKTYCSVACRRAEQYAIRKAKRPAITYVETKCQVCGVTFNKACNTTRIYCSDVCAKKAEKKRARTRITETKSIKQAYASVCTCKICGVQFIRTGARGPINKFCAPCYKEKEDSRRKKYRVKYKEKLNDQAKARYRKKRDEYLTANNEEIEKRKAIQKQQSKETRLRWIAANPDKVRSYKERGADKRRARARRQHAKYSSTLADPYIKHLLTQNTAISKKSVPQSLVDLKRVQVLITRKLKELNDAEPNDRD